MSTFVRIDRPDDPRVADYRTLKDPELRKRYEHERGVFIAEGPNVVRELVASRYPVRSLLLDERRVEELAPLVDDLDVPVHVTTRELLYEIVAFKLHQGAIAVGGRLPLLEPSDVLAGAGRVVVLDAMNDHENMGVVFRTVRALGADGVLLGPRSADPLYRRCVRVSMGHVLHVPHATIGPMPEAYDLLRDAGLTVLALTPDPRAPALADVAPGPVAIVVGAEGPGLDDGAIAAADVRARIPIAGDVDSLNVATATAIALYALS